METVYAQIRRVFGHDEFQAPFPHIVRYMNVPFGIQQLQLGRALTSNSNAERALLAAKEAGFDCIELNGFMIRKTPLIARLLLSASGMPIKRSQKLDWQHLLKESDLNVISIHEDLGTLENNFDVVAKEISLYEPRFIVLTGMYRFPYDDEERLGELVVRLNRVGRKLKEEGVSFLYHNHSAEFQHVDMDQNVYDFLMAGLNPDWVNFEFDSYWAISAGADPKAWINRLKGRLKLYHVCDRGNRDKGPYMTPIIASDAMELGRGNMNLDEYIPLAVECGAEAIILEQHRNYIAKDPIASLQISAKYLKQFHGK